MKQLNLQIEGMGGDHCVRVVEKILTGLDGVQIEKVTVGQAQLAFENDRIDENRIIAAIQRAGYKVKPTEK